MVKKAKKILVVTNKIRKFEEFAYMHSRKFLERVTCTYRLGFTGVHWLIGVAAASRDAANTNNGF